MTTKRSVYSELETQFEWQICLNSPSVSYYKAKVCIWILHLFFTGEGKGLSKQAIKEQHVTS